MPFIAELKRRNVFRVGVAYAIVAWLLIEVASVILPTFKTPEWVMQAFTTLVILGFPLTLVMAWAFELTPEGIKRDSDVDPDESITHNTGRKLDFAIIGLLAVALIFVVVDNYVLEAESEPVKVAAEETPEAEPIEREKSIAVLPFDNISPNPEDAYFADGIHDEILAQISKIRDIKVISRTSVMRYRGEDKPSSPEIGAALGVANLLEGSVRLAGNRVRITIQLIEAERDAHLWTETYDRELTTANIFSIQSEIANIIADELRATLTPEEKHRLDTVPTENMAAYQAYLLGKQRLAKMTSDSVAEAGDHFQRAIDLDPSFALAYVGLADAYIGQVYVSGLPREELLAKAEAAAGEALKLDDQLGDAYNSLGGIKFARFDARGAEAAYQRALELNPNYAAAYSGYGDLLRRALGRPEEALALDRKAIELDPLSAEIVSSLGNDLAALGRSDEALALWENALEADPELGIYDAISFHYWFTLGRLDDAAVWFANGISNDPGDPSRYAFLGWLFLDLGAPDRAESWIYRSLEMGPESRWPNEAMSLLHLYRDDEAALDFVRKIHANYSYYMFPLVFLRDHALRAGRYSDARALYQEVSPELLNEEAPKIDTEGGFINAIDLALVLSHTGEQERADLLLDRSLQHIQTIPRLSFNGYWIADVMIYALQGEKQKALLALRQAIDEGWRTLWWYYLKYNPNLESLHDEPEFQAMVAEIEADMAEQLERVREMERNGELEPIPEISATTH
jgi:TolB-like protein